LMPFPLGCVSIVVAFSAKARLHLTTTAKIDMDLMVVHYMLGM
jgi:hypothetical protein